MANINSDAFWTLIEGSTDDDTITLTGKGSTIQSYRGNDLIELGKNSWTGNNLVYAGAGNDTIKINSSATVYGDAGNDYFGVYGIQGVGGNLILDGGAGADYFYLDTSSLSRYLSYTISNTTITGGDGSDTIRINPAVKNISAVITDFSADDVFVNDTDDVAGEFLTYSTTSNGVVLQDSDPNTFSVTLKGVSLSDIANATYMYDGGSKTFGEIFGISASGKNISNTNDNTQITGTSYADTISSTGNYVTISAGAGNDSINNRRVDVLGDTDKSYGNFFNGGSGNDTITVYYNDSSEIYGGDGDDSIVAYNGWLGSHINKNMKIYGGAGNDTITFNGKNSTFYGGTGNDVISLSNTDNQNQGDRLIVYEGGNDTIYGFLFNDTLSLGSGGYYTRKTVGNDVVISLTSGGSITFKNTSAQNIVGGNETVPVTALNITNSTSYKYIEGTSYEDTIVNLTGGWGSTIYGNGGADSITDYSFSDMIYGGDGNDTILNIGEQSYLYGNAGDDFIYVASGTAGKNTIYGGTGNDKISLGGGKGSNGYYSSDYGGDHNLIIYNSGDGNDIIYNFYNTDTLQVVGAKYTTTTSGNNLIVGVGSGSITLSGVTSANIKGTLASNSNSLYIEGTSGADNITNTLTGATINALAGNDTVWNYAGNVSMVGGAGNDFINNWDWDNAHNVKIFGGDGADTLRNIGNNVTMDGGAGNDSITSWGGNVSINSGNDNDYVNISHYYGKAKNITADAGAGNDVIYSSGENVLINAGAGDDWFNIFNNSTGDDDVVYYADSHTINAGAGSDTIYFYAPNSKINGDEGNDYIQSNWNENITISGGAGNDTISIGSDSSNNLIQYSNGEGNDIIHGLKSGDTLKISGSTYTTTTSGNNLMIGVGSGKITVSGGANVGFTIEGTLESSEEENTLPAGWKFNSTLATATLSSADDLDLTQDYGANIKNVNASITSGGVVIIGNDLNNSIRAGKGADLIYDGGGNDTVSLGAGADTYIYSSGNDLIQDYATVDVIQIDTENGVEVTNIETVSSNVVIETSEGNITLKSGKGKNISLVDSDGADIEINPPVDDLYIAGTSGADNISNTLAEATIDALAGNDNISNEADNVSISGGAGRDKITNDGYYTTINGGAGVDTIENYGDYNIYQYASGDGNDTIIGFTENDTLTITSGNYSYSVSGSDFIVKVGSSTIKLVDAANKIIHINNEEIPPVTSDLPEGWKYGTSSKTNTNTSIITATISSAEKEIDLTEAYGDGVEKVDAAKISDSKIIGNDSDNSIKTGAGNDELDGDAGNDTLTGGKGDDIFIYSGGDDVITDYGTGADSIQIDTNYIEFTAYETLKSDVIYTTNKGTLTIKNAIKSGKLKDIILMDEGGNVINYPDTLPAGWKYSASSNAEIVATIKSAADIDLTESYGADIEIVDGSSMNGGVIFGNDLDNSIKGGAGNNTLGGGAGNDTLEGNTGADTFIYSEGDDRIINYIGGKDSIQIDVDNISAEKIQREVDGEDVIFYIEDAGELIVQNAKDQKITLMDSNGKEIILDTLPRGWKFDSSKNLLQATINTAENEIDLTESYGNGVQKVDGSKITSGVIIIANDLNNSIKGSKGADEISGGAGNDTVSLGAGDDLYIYGGGDDTILDYAAGHDSIQVDINEIEIYSVDTVGSNVIYYTDAGNITLKNGKGKNITLIDANGDEIIIEEKTLPEGWKFGTTSKTNTTAEIVSATLKTAENIDLTENYGDGVISINAATVIGGIEIFGNDLDNSIKGGKGGDTISGGAGNDTVSLGAGADVYIYSGGDDNIINYAAGKDSIQIDTANIEITGVETSGNDLIYETSEGNLKIVKGNGKDITLMDMNGEEINIGGAEYPEGWTFDSSKNLLRATISSAVDEIDLSENYGAGVEKVDGSKITSGVVIYGNDDNISMKGSKSADTISGGYGNDTVSLGGGADVYIYNGGNDLIQDYATVDAIQIDTNEITVYGYSTISTNKIIETSEGNITLKGAKTKNITLLDENEEEIAVSGRVAENVWFLEDDNNFVASDIDSITENKFAVTEIQSYNNETFTQDSSILTFAKEK